MGTGSGHISRTSPREVPHSEGCGPFILRTTSTSKNDTIIECVVFSNIKDYPKNTGPYCRSSFFYLGRLLSCNLSKYHENTSHRQEFILKWGKPTHFHSQLVTYGRMGTFWVSPNRVQFYVPRLGSCDLMGTDKKWPVGDTTLSKSRGSPNHTSIYDGRMEKLGVESENVLWKAFSAFTCVFYSCSGVKFLCLIQKSQYKIISFNIIMKITIVLLDMNEKKTAN